jgi:hypothetical protein
MIKSIILTVVVESSAIHLHVLVVNDAAERATVDVPDSMFLYHLTTSSPSTSGAPRLLSTMMPSESMTLYVGMAGWAEGVTNDMFVVNLLLTAPGNRTLCRSKEYISFDVKFVYADPANSTN